MNDQLRVVSVCGVIFKIKFKPHLYLRECNYY